MTIFYTTYTSPLGMITAFATDRALIGLYFPTQEPPQYILATYTDGKSHKILSPLKTWLEQYWSQEVPHLVIPIDPPGTDFQRRVWQELCTIPYGTSESYGTIANRLFHHSGGAQAVGRAVGANPISIVIPCHRILGCDGQLTGYSGGLFIKESLLTLEQIPYRQ